MTGDQNPLNLHRELTERLDVSFVIQAGGLSVWKVDQTTNQVIWDDRCHQLCGIAKDNTLPYEQATQFIHPNDVSRIAQAVQ